MRRRYSTTTRSNRSVPTVWPTVLRALLLLIPAGVLAIAGFRSSGELTQIFLIGAGFQILICALGLLTRAFQRQPVSSVIILLYGLALAWLFLGRAEKDWYFHLSQALLLVIPLVAIALQTLTDIGAPAMRKARVLAHRLEGRRKWPPDLESCRLLPEVKALREALHLDASPALELLQDRRPQVQIAALAAVEYRARWYSGQAEMILQVALQAEQPEVRAAALIALANVDDRYIVESLAEHLRDPAPQVRHAAREALLWDTESRWAWIRHAVRRSLADPLCQCDGALRCEGSQLTPMAVDDLTAWASEKGLIGARAAQSLAAHYSQAALENPDTDLFLAMAEQIRDPQRPPLLRIELARVLLENYGIEEDILIELLDSGNPAPLRLLVIEALLQRGDSQEARMALRELARSPNREIALATAEVVQRCLKVDLGAPEGQPLPALHSRQAAELSRRVMAWASQSGDQSSDTLKGYSAARRDSPLRQPSFVPPGQS